MRPNHTDDTRRWLSALYVCMQNEKASKKRIKLTPTLSPKDFTNSQKKFIENLIEKLWDIQPDVVTRGRVLSALTGGDKALIDAAQKNIEEWGEKIWKPGISESIKRAGGSITSDIADSINSRLFFDLTHDSIQKWLDVDAGELIKTFNRNVIDNVKATIKAAITNEWGVIETKALIGEGLTLIPSWQNALVKFYDQQYKSLYKEFLKDFPPGKAAEKARAVALRRQARRYRKRIDTRKEMIARTELNRAYGASQESSFIQAQQLGKIKNVARTWRRTNSQDNHQSSIDNDGVTLPLGKPFTGGGMSMMFEEEINGQCIVEFDYEAVK